MGAAEKLQNGPETSKPKKNLKIKLNKEQKLFVREMVGLENRIKLCQEYILLWRKFFSFFAEDMAAKEIAPAEEKAFFQIQIDLARKQFLFTELMGDKFDHGEELLQTLAMAVSLQHIKNMPESLLDKLEIDWHNLFLEMNKSLGRLLRMLPGNMSLDEAIKFVNTPPDERPGAKKRKAKPAAPPKPQTKAQTKPAAPTSPAS